MSEKEIRNVVKFLRKEAGEIEYEEIIPEPEEQRSFEGQTLAWDDPLLEEVKQLVIQTNKASASYLQRRFRIGYARAASLLDMLEQEGLIGPADGAKPREVLVKRKGEEEELGELDETVKENVEKDTDDLDEIPTPPVEEDEENEEETEEKDEF